MNAHMNLNRLAYFSAVVEGGSFTVAAERLGITKAVVSQQVAKLEREVGATLLIRTSRRVRPTEAGSAFHSRCMNILREAADAFDELAHAANEPTGTLRITAPFDYGTSVVSPALTRFTARYPKCEVVLSLNDKTVDMVGSNFDVAIHVGWLADSGLQAKRLGSFEQILVCSSDLVDQVVDVRAPRDVAGLPFITNAALRSPSRWIFTRSRDDKEVVEVASRLSMDATPAVYAAVLAGGGVSVLPDFLVASDLLSGRLIRVLPSWRLPSGGIHVVLPASRFRPAKVSAFVNLLADAERQRSRQALAVV